ncbi:hypothetical protein [Loigolactobacillus backii]|uniref:hypothetical protein n=1 Tax=Loigolactobacillus backii TaxID=375175 RepID=UPI000AE287C2|nr:hypothetical protein [Loigolactobacillus backii]
MLPPKFRYCFTTIASVRLLIPDAADATPINVAVKADHTYFLKPRSNTNLSFLQVA